MELTEEIKCKVFAQYLGHAVELDNFGSKVRNRILCAVGGIGDCEYVKLRMGDFAHPVLIKSNHAKLVLRPLTAITDDEAIEMARLFGGVEDVGGNLRLNRPADLENKDIHFAVQVYVNEPLFRSYNTPKYWTDAHGVGAYQWLQQKGFDLPHYLLGGKTLRECDLCVY